MIGFIILSVALVALFLGLFASVAVSASRIRLELPQSRPDAFLERLREREAQGQPENRPVVVCAGDSITQGAISTDWVAMLGERRPDLAFVNAGINSEMAWNLAQRLDPIVECKPASVIILIGTNDANASLGFSNTLGYLAMYKLPEAPTEAFFRDNLLTIVRALKRRTQARIALVSLPPLGEDPLDYAWARVEEYCAIIKRVSQEEGVDYLPLGEALRQTLSALEGGRARSLKDSGKMEQDSLVGHYVKGRSWDDISAANGFTFLIDGIHLNGRATGILTDLVSSYLEDLR